MSDPDIIEPFGVNDSPLVMVVSDSPVYRDTIQAYLLDFNYRIAGPFSNVDRGHSFIRRQVPDLIVFDAITSQNELISFSNVLQNEAQDVPILVVHNNEGFSINHDLVEFIIPPIEPNELEHKISDLLDPDQIDANRPSTRFVKFVNRTLSTLYELAPEYSKVDLKEILDNTVNKLAVRNSEITIPSEETFNIQIKQSDNIELQSFAKGVKLLFQEIIDEIDARMEANWGSSLVEDALETVTLDLKDLPTSAISIVQEFGKGYQEVLNKYSKAVPDFESLDRNIVVSKLLLTDWGPELRETVGTSQKLKKDFTNEIASQLITLVGQGSKYHEGIFGPVPISKSDDVIAIIWSKLIKSDIQDERMGGNTLVLVVIGFRKAILNLIPSREDLKDIFGSVDVSNHEKEIGEDELKFIAQRFLDELQ